jgi:hypothetical protein
MRVVTAPFRVGDPAVWLEAVPEGMKVEQTAVLDVRPEGDGWTVVTPIGTEHVDERGEGSQLVALDAEMAAEFRERGSSFVIRSTVDDIVRDLDPSPNDWRRFERELGREPDQGYGHER